jgi:hypothetical protein
LLRSFLCPKWDIVFALDVVLLHLRAGSKVELSDGSFRSADEDELLKHRLYEWRSVSLKLAVDKSWMVGIDIYVLRKEGPLNDEFEIFGNCEMLLTLIPRASSR